MYTSVELANICGFSRQGIQKFMANLHIDYTKDKNKHIYIASSKHHDFFESIRLATINNKVKPFYSLHDLALARYNHKDTIKKLLIKNNITLYRSGKKFIILLVDLQRLSHK
jgi:hypothetical protein